MTTTYNLNALCKVQVNDFGKRVWKMQIDLLKEDVKKNNPLIVEGIERAIDENGFIEMELWKFMMIFGPYMSPVKTPFETTTIELRPKPED